MQKKVTVMALIAVIALTLAMPVAAQTSNTKTSTAGLFSNDVDYFNNYHKYANVFKNGGDWFAYVTGVANTAILGYARNFGGLYLGIYYRGNIVNLGSQTETHSLTPTWNDPLEILEQTTETTSFGGTQLLSSNNRFEFLIGVAGQGIKVGFYENYSVDQNAGSNLRDIVVVDHLDGRKDYTGAVVDYQYKTGTITPYLGWGTNIPIGGMNLMPFVDLSFAIYENKQVDIYESYTTVNGNKQSVDRSVGAGYNSGYLTPSASLGAKLDLAKKNTSVPQLSLTYAFSMNLYNNDYSATGLSGDSVPGTVSWTTGSVDRETHYADRTETATNLTLNINERTSMTNQITLRYQITGEPLDNFKLGFYTQVPVNLTSSSTNQYTRAITKTVVKYNWDNPGYTSETEALTYQAKTETSNFSLGLNLGLGASYKLIPDRFAINAGITATPLTWSYQTVKTTPNSANITTSKTTQDDGSVTQNDKTVTLSTTADSVAVTDYWNWWSANLYGGFVFNFNDKAALDLGANAASGDTGFNLNLAYVNVIFTFKF